MTIYTSILNIQNCTIVNHIVGNNYTFLHAVMSITSINFSQISNNSIASTALKIADIFNVNSGLINITNSNFTDNSMLFSFVSASEVFIDNCKFINNSYGTTLIRYYIFIDN